MDFKDTSVGIYVNREKFQKKNINILTYIRLKTNQKINKFTRNLKSIYYHLTSIDWHLSHSIKIFFFQKNTKKNKKLLLKSITNNNIQIIVWFKRLDVYLVIYREIEYGLRYDKYDLLRVIFIDSNRTIQIFWNNRFVKCFYIFGKTCCSNHITN